MARPESSGLFVLLCSLCALTVLAEPRVHEVISLVNWNLYSTANVSDVYAVTVPNTVLGALLSDTNRYPFDPFYSKNLDLINESDFLVPWVWNTTFAVRNDSSSAESRVLLKLDGLNYYSVLHVNNFLVANESQLVGGFRRYELDITPFVSLWGAMNTISIQVRSESHTPRKWRSHNTALSYNFMDWNPHPKDLSMGIYRKAEVQVMQFTSASQRVNSAGDPTTQPLLTVDGIAVKTTLPPTLPGQTLLALLNASFVVKSWSVQATETFFYLDLGFNTTDSEGESLRVILKSDMVVLSPAEASPDLSGALVPSEQRIFFNWESYSLLIVENPTMWWPWQMGEQNMFVATVYASDSVTSLKSVHWGIREVRQELNQGGALQFYINNIPLQFRGGGWTSEMFTREKSFNHLVKEFSLIREMGLNGLRLEGMLESDLFYDVADQMGIVLLPGLPCCDGWQNWSHWPASNYPIARQSIIDQARRLESHPSVIGFFEASDSLPPPDVERMYTFAFVQEAWPNALISSASQQVSNISGNPGVKMVGPYSWEPPSYWLTDGNGLVDGNYGGAWGFFTEGGPGESPMTLASWNRTVPAEHIWNPEFQSMDSYWNYHMGEPFGSFRNLTYYTPPLNARYGESTSARQYLYKAQAANYEGIRAFVESYSRNKHRNATGFVQWMMNNAWPSHLWHLYDFYLVAGGGYYGAKTACEDLHAMMSYDDGSVWLINSRFHDFGEVTVFAQILNLAGTVVWERQQTVPAVPSDASFPLTDIPYIPLNGQPFFNTTDTFLVHLLWTYLGVQNTLVTKENWYWLNPLPDVIEFDQSNGFRTPCSSFTNFSQLNSLPPAQVTAEVTQVSNQQLQVIVTASSSNPSVAFFTNIRLVNRTSGLDIAPQFWNDNYFSLTPGQSRVLTVATIMDDYLYVPDIITVVETWNDQVAN